jgi:hypothetical protein
LPLGHKRKKGHQFIAEPMTHYLLNRGTVFSSLSWAHKAHLFLFNVPADSRRKTFAAHFNWRFCLDPVQCSAFAGNLYKSFLDADIFRYHLSTTATFYFTHIPKSIIKGKTPGKL